MIQFVIKKDGSRTPFDAEKIKHGVMQAALEAEISEPESAKIAQEVLDFLPRTFENVTEVTSEELRNKILTELDATHPSVAESWRMYEEGKNE